MLKLAHLSDVHLGPLPPPSQWGEFHLKRLVGFMSWRFKRSWQHDPAVAALIVNDIKSAAPDHVAFTGDIVNISAHAEFPPAARWTEQLGDLSFVPGNHDCYVRCAWEKGLCHFAAWMTSDMRVARTTTSHHIAAPFPYVRLRKNIALLGLSSAQPQPLRRAGGELGAAQLDSLGTILRELRQLGFARVVLIHHPPLPGLAVPRKALTDAARLKDVLEREGAELVLHGHNHQHMRNPLQTATGTAHALGVPSASMNGHGRDPPAAWNLYEISRQDGRWLTQVTVRGFDPLTHAIKTLEEFSLSS